MELSSEFPNINLIPLIYRGETILYDIYDKAESGKDIWIGSRRTLSACALFVGLPELSESFRKAGL